MVAEASREVVGSIHWASGDRAATWLVTREQRLRWETEVGFLFPTGHRGLGYRRMSADNQPLVDVGFGAR